MLKSLEIQNFKSIVSAKLEFGKINLFIGPNGGGKTNLLEAIGVVSAALGRSVNPEDLDQRGVRLSLPRLFKATYKNRRIPLQFKLIARTQHAEYMFTLSAGDQSTSLAFNQEKLVDQNETVIGRSPQGYKIHKPRAKFVDDSFKLPMSPSRGIFDVLRSFADISPESVSELDRLNKYVIYSPQTAILRGVAYDPRLLEPLGLTGGRLASAVQELLRAYSKNRDELRKHLRIIWASGWSDLVRVSGPLKDVVPPQVPTVPKVVYFRDKFMHSDRSWLSPYDASEGTLYLLFVATLLAHPNAPRMFALDNVDGTLNPKVVRQLIEHIVETVGEEEGEEERQVFLTSHNPTALDALDLFNENHRVFVVRRDPEAGGQTEFQPLRPAKGMTRDDWIKLQEGRNTSEMWLEGLIPGALG